jgi:DNA polymerase-3 subunit alpha
VFVHLNTHSHYSFLRALPSPEDLAKAAAEAGMPAVALTDQGILSGAVEFFLACLKHKIRPIVGLEIDVSTPNEVQSLVLLAESMRGWRNLCRISSSIHLGDDPGLPASIDLICGNSQDLIALIDPLGPGGERSIHPVAELFPGSCYVQVRDGDPNLMNKSHDRAKKLQLPPVAIHPIFFLRSVEAPLLRTMAAIESNRTIRELPGSVFASPGAFFLRAE